LGEHIENLTLAGTGHIDGKGNTENNLITGNSGNNRIDGVAGADTMAGGLGDDIYVVDNASDAVNEALSEGTDTVEASVSYNLSANVEKLNLTGTGNINGTGNDLANTLTGNSGNNSLDGGAGADSMIGGSGDDIYFVDNASDAVTEALSEGTDTVEALITFALTANVENLNLKGTGNINGTGNGLNNSLTGNNGNNSLDGGAGADSMSGGAGNDTYVVDNAADGVTEALGAGTDTVVSSIGYTLGEHLENLTLTGTGHINGTGNELANTLTGNSGNNTLDGGVGNDTMVGGAGNDTYVVDSTGDLITEASGAGTDTVESSIDYTLAANVEHLTLAGTATIGTGNVLNNTLTANNLGNTLSGGAGTDTLIGGDGVDLLDGGTEADSMRGGAGNDTYLVDHAGDVVTELATQGTTDTVEASINYTLTAHVEKLILTGTAAINGTGNNADNTITGNSGNNSLTGGVGADTIDGGGGINTASYTASDAGVTVSLVAGATNTGGHALGDVLSNIHNLLGSAHADTLIGDASDNRLEGGAGNDALSGGAGTDTLIGGAGADSFNGGDGADTVSYAGSTAVTVSLASGATNTGGDAQGDTFSTVENLIGSNNNDTLTGDGNANILDGGIGNDRLNGGGGADTLVGGLGDDVYEINGSGVTIVEIANQGTDRVESTVDHTLGDHLENLQLMGSANLRGTGNTLNNTLTGNAGDNTLSGGDGQDTLIGGAGNDSLIGGAGNDTLDLRTGNTNLVGDTADGGAGSDTVIIAYSALGGSVDNLNGGADTDTLQVHGTSGVNLNALNAFNFEKLDFATDTSATNVLLSSTGIMNLVNNSGVDVLTLRLGSNDSYTITPETGITVTQGQSVSFYNGTAAPANLVAQVNFEYA
jgi:Ca2+-binding RTX toxin-like protein